MGATLSVARKFEQKVAKFEKTPKYLHQSTCENPKYLHQRSFKRQKYLHQSTKRKSQNRFKTGLKPVFIQIFKSSQKSSQKEQVAKEKILVAKWCQK